MSRKKLAWANKEVETFVCILGGEDVVYDVYVAAAAIDIRPTTKAEAQLWSLLSTSPGVLTASSPCLCLLNTQRRVLGNQASVDKTSGRTGSPADGRHGKENAISTGVSVTVDYPHRFRDAANAVTRSRLLSVNPRYHRCLGRDQCLPRLPGRAPCGVMTNVSPDSLVELRVGFSRQQRPLPRTVNQCLPQDFPGTSSSVGVMTNVSPDSLVELSVGS
ncbi:unnamed protein product [Boreogadus saida]